MNYGSRWPSSVHPRITLLLAYPALGLDSADMETSAEFAVGGWRQCKLGGGLVRERIGSSRLLAGCGPSSRWSERGLESATTRAPIIIGLHHARWLKWLAGSHKTRRAARAASWRAGRTRARSHHDNCCLLITVPVRGRPSSPARWRSSYERLRASIYLLSRPPVLRPVGANQRGHIGPRAPSARSPRAAAGPRSRVPTRPLELESWAAGARKSAAERRATRCQWLASHRVASDDNSSALLDANESEPIICEQRARIRALTRREWPRREHR